MTDDFQVRQARPEDGPALMIAIEQINNETEFLGVPGEGHPWDGRPEQELRRLRETGSGLVLVAVEREAIVGYMLAFLGWFERNRGNLFIAVVGLRAAYRGRGLGTRLFEAAEDWARERGVWRMELRVSSLNRRGQALYHKRGFAIEGTIRKGVPRGGAWTDDYWMGKLLDTAAPAMPVPAEDGNPRRAGRHATHTLIVREMRPGDGPAFRDWEVRMLAGNPLAIKRPNNVASAEIIERDIAETGGDPRLWLVAVQQDMYGPEAVIAFAAVSIEQRFRMNHDGIVNISVLPEWTRQGLGRRLHGRIEDWARDRGIRRLTASIQAALVAGRNFAAAMGYQQEVVMRGQSRIDGLLVDRVRFGKLLV